jgi:hypothetical protein
MTTSIRDRERDRTRSPFVRAATRVLPLAAAVACLGAAALPAHAAEPWGFEQVTPVNKGAGAVHPIDTFQASPDGNGFLMTATGSFDAAPAESVPLYVRYMASRGADGWSSRPLDPPSDPIPPSNIAVVMQTLGASADASHVMVVSTRALTPDAPADGYHLYIRNTATGAYTLVASNDNSQFALQFVANLGQGNVLYVGSDGRSALFTSRVPLVPGAPDGTVDTSIRGGLYKWTAEDGVEVVSVLPESEGGGMPEIADAVGGGDSDSSIRNPLPDRDGLDHVYFSDRGSSKVYVRSGDQTKAVSVSRIPGADSEPVSAKVWATGRGGRYMLFSSYSPLPGQGGVPLTPDTPTDIVGWSAGSFLYRYDAVEDSLAYVGATQQLPLTPDPVQMTQDGQTVAFWSRLALTPGAYEPDELDETQNLYVWRDGALRFVAKADAGSAPTNTAGYLRVLSAGGRYLAFTDNSTGPMSAAERTGANLGEPSSDPGCRRDMGGGVYQDLECPQVFVFDADANDGAGKLQCASCRSDGGAARGPAGDPTTTNPGHVRMDWRQMQTVADDGTVFFTASDDLVAADSNGYGDVYAYRDGEQWLLSRAGQGVSARFLDATPDGKSVFFATNDAIASTDTDRAVDVYLTRAGAGFPFTPPVVVPPCSSSECRDPLAAVGPLLAPIGSLTFTAPADRRARATTVRVSKLKAVTGARAVLRVRVPSAGSIRVFGPTVRNATKRTGRAATYRVPVTLSAKARKALAKRGTVKVRVRVAFRATGGESTRRAVMVTFKKPKTGRRASAGGR